MVLGPAPVDVGEVDGVVPVPFVLDGRGDRVTDRDGVAVVDRARRVELVPRPVVGRPVGAVSPRTGLFDGGVAPAVQPDPERGGGHGRAGGRRTGDRGLYPAGGHRGVGATARHIAGPVVRGAGEGVPAAQGGPRLRGAVHGRGHGRAPRARCRAGVDGGADTGGGRLGELPAGPDGGQGQGDDEQYPA